MSLDGIKWLQRELAARGLYSGALDGLWGPKTQAAVSALLRRPDTAPAPAPAPSRRELPWIEEGRKVFGLHEVRDNAALVAWLRSDRKALGDPAALPWCGDYVETCIKNALPDEPFTGALGTNPYWARNWITFGKRVEPTYGAVMVFERGAASGHVGFVVGEDDTDWYILGGNQGDSVNVSRLLKRRLLACRWPSTFPHAPAPVPRMTAGTIPRTSNEV